jgi:hypothetical protein
VTAVGHAAIIVAERKALLARTESLVREFHPTLPAGTVIHAVTRCRAELLRAGVRRGLAGTTEARVRAQLARMTANVGVGSGSPRRAEGGVFGGAPAAMAGASGPAGCAMGDTAPSSTGRSTTP